MTEHPTAPAQRFLVACHDISLAGGLLRFERLGRVLKRQGHHLAYVAFAENPKPAWTPEFPVLAPDRAADEQWDAVFVPGASFPQATIAQFDKFRDRRFGTRVQHILNDQMRRQQFMAVNRSFAPDIVVFNNEHWPAGSFTEFKADRFHVLLGAVDTRRFTPANGRSWPLSKGRWTVGGLANKNPAPLIEAVSGMPGAVLKLFGGDNQNVAARFPHLVEQGRLRFVGRLGEDELVEFYRSVDCVVMTETNAGWANLVAEAMASGVPVVCTPHGTTAFARDMQTALVVGTPGPDELRAALERLRDDPEFCRRLALAARETIEPFGWEPYAQKLLDVIQGGPGAHYYAAPEIGLFGKWPVQHRMQGLELLFEHAGNSTVLDLGAAEGVIGLQLLRQGARLVHGFERDAGKVARARELTNGDSRAEFRVADLADWARFMSEHGASLQGSYEIVLFLGIHHHLPLSARSHALRGAIGLAARYFAYRAPDKLREAERVDETLTSMGFRLLATRQDLEHMGGCRVYERST